MEFASISLLYMLAHVVTHATLYIYYEIVGYTIRHKIYNTN